MQGYLADCGPCPYLPGRRFRAFLPEPNPPTMVSYRELLDLRFRRSGDHLYMPMCQDCTACEPIRLAISTFRPRTDQRRNRKRNADLALSFHARGADPERTALYQRYQAAIHQKENDDPGSSLVADGGIPGGELHARDAHGTLLAVSIVDIIGDALSSVYCYYAPEARARGLGTFMILAEIELAERLGLAWLYLGFQVEGCRKMAYKARFGPAEILRDGEWIPVKNNEPRN